MMDSTDSAAKPAASTSSRPPTAAEAGKTAPSGSSNAGFRNNPPDDDDEEEEGMLKVDEEGQIEDDGADQQVSPPSFRGDGARPISLADRLTPLPDASAAKSGGAGPSHSNGSGYVSPRHMNLDRERERDRDRDRYLETSPGPSSAFGASRSRYGHPADAAGAYGAPAPYSYPSGHRDPHRADSFSSASRAGFGAAAGAARADTRRGWYPPATPTRGPDTYRPGAVRERERDREWESFRGEREWSAIDRDREREAYRDMVDKRRDWPPRERGAAPFSYDLADPAAPYPAPASSKYSSRDPPGRRPLSPQPLSARERDFEADRSRDRERERTGERDPRMRASSSGWGNGMRQWGKPSDAGWDNRSTRPPTSDDARSDASQRPSLSRSNNTPPPATSSEGPGRPIGSDNASVKSETRSREMTPHSQSASHGGRARSDALEAPAKSASERDGDVSTVVKKEAVEQELSASEQPSTKVDAESRPPAPEAASAAKAEADAASEAAKPESTSAPSPQKEQLPADKAATSSEPPVKQLQEQSEEVSDAATNERVEEGSKALDSTDAQSATAPASIAEAAVDEQPTRVTSEAADQAKEDESTAEVAEMPSKDIASEKEDGEANAAPTTAEAEPKSATVEAPAASEPTGDKPPAKAEPLSADQGASGEEEPTRNATKDEATSAGPSAPEVQDIPMDTQPAEPLAEADDATSKPQPRQLSPIEHVASTRPDQTSAPAETPFTDAAPARTEAPVPSESVQAPEQSMSEPKAADNADVDMADAVPEQPSASTHVVVPQVDAPASTANPEEMSKAETTESVVEPTTQDKQSLPEEDVEMSQEPASEPLLAADDSVKRGSEPPAGDIETSMSVDDKPQEQEAEVQAPAEQPATVAPVIESSAVLPGTGVDLKADDVSTTKAAPDTETPTQPDVKAEESAVQSTEDVEMDEAKAADEPASNGPAESSQAAPPATASDEAVPTSEPAAHQPSQTQVSGPHVTATIDHENRTKEITLPQVNYGDDKQAQALVQQENARIEEVEMPSENHKPAPLRIAEEDDETQVEPPLMTPTTQEQLERSIRSAVRLHIHEFAPGQYNWKRVLKENQRVAQKTTLDVLTAKIHGIPQIVSSDKPLWLEEQDGLTDRTKAVLFDRLLDRKKRLIEKTESLKKRYRSINEEWKQHCSRLDRIAERREMARRPPATTPAGTPGAFGGVEDPTPGSAGASLLGASFATGRANRRSAQAGFAGFGDAVRSEAEFLEILASLENADMQDPNMRAARTTATAPDMFINPDSDQPLKLRYDDINGSVADPLAFYLDEFDPDVWSEEEKAIFARRYALWPKQFGKIAQALPHKTPAQCVRYYYLNKKLPGNDFKALAAARNRERKRKARVKPKKVKGSALMADLKSAKGEEVDEVEDSSGMRSPMDATDPSGVSADMPASANSRRGGRSRLGLAAVDSGAGVHSDDAAAGRKRHADQIESESSPAETKASDKRKSGAKSKRAKSDSASATDKSRKSKAGGKKDSAAVEDRKSSTAGPLPAVAKTESSDVQPVADVAAQPAAVTEATAPVKGSLEDSDLAAAEALGALAGLFGAAPPSGEAGIPSAAPASSDPTAAPLEAKAGKKRRSKTATPGEDGATEGTPKGRGRQPTSSYWSVAERSEFLRALVVHGPRWDVVSSTLAQKSAAQARNYFARNESEPDFAEAAALARSHAELPVAEREEAALTFVRQRFANNAAAAAASAAPNAAANMPGSGAGFNGEVPRTTHLPPPPGIVTSQADGMDVKMREGSPELPVQRRGLQINSLLNDTSDTHVKRRSSLHDWQEQREVAAHAGAAREASVPPALYARPPFELERRPVTAEAPRPLSSDGRPGLDEVATRPRVYEREGSVDSRSWAYEAPYEAHRRPSPSPGYSAMAPPPRPGERSMAASRYPGPPSVAGPGHVARSVPPMSTHAHASDEAEHDRERDRSLYGTYGSAGRSREYEAHSMPPAVPGELRHSSGEQVSPTGASFGAGHAYGRYAPPSVGSIYASSAAATTALSARGRSANGPLTAPLPSTSERPAYEQRWQRYSQSPGPPGTAAASSAGSGIASGFSTGSAYRSSASPYSSFPSQSLPRPSLPSLSAGAAKGAPHLPSLGAAGRSLPPILGSFPAPGRGLGGAARPAGTGEEARYWPYPQRPRGHDAQDRNAE